MWSALTRWFDEKKINVDQEGSFYADQPAKNLTDVAICISDNRCAASGSFTNEAIGRISTSSTAIR